MAGRYSRRRGTRRAPLRKFVWARSIGQGVINAPDTEPVGYSTDLLQQFKDAYGADPLGCTVMRIRGKVVWSVGQDLGVVGIGAIGIRTFTEPLTPDEEGPLTAPHADWMMYQPAYTYRPTAQDGAAWYALQMYDIDVKSNRKLEELGQGLGLFTEHNIAGVTGNIHYNLSIGLKLP